MTKTTLAVYERNSTLWKNANAFYKAQDWVKMECYFADYSEDRDFMRSNNAKFIDANGNDITETQLADCYVILLTNKSGLNTRSFEFATRDEANKAFKELFNHKNLTGWKKVKC